MARLLDAAGENPEEARQWRVEEAELLKRDAGLLPGEPSPHYRRGMLLYLLGEMDEARQELVEACRMGPNDYQSWLALALICEKQQRWKQAVSALERMAQLQPNDPTPVGIYRRIQQTLADQRAAAEESAAGDEAEEEAAETTEQDAEIQQLQEAAVEPEAEPAPPPGDDD